MKTKKKYPLLPKKQKQGIFLLIGIGLGIIITILIIISLNIGSDYIIFHQDEITHSKAQEYSSKSQGEKYYKQELKSSNSKNRYNPFLFNPNTISKTDLIKFGLSDKQANNLVNYVKAGGKFQKAEDLKKLYCMSEQLYKQMSPYVNIPQSNIKENTNPSSITNTNFTYKSNKSLTILELNEADTLDLQALRGIGPSYARRIYIYGKKLGGYVKVEQLKEVYGMTDTLYNSIIPYLKLEKRNPKKLNINTSNIKQLSSHPYIDFYLAKAIIKLRIELNNYKSIYQLRQIHLLDQNTYEKLLPYLEL